MHEELKIQPATPDDLLALLQLVNSAYRGDSSKAGWTTEADLLGGIRISETGLSAIFKNPSATILKAENKEGRLVGCVSLELQEDAMYLGMLTVEPGLQNTGIGKQLLRAGEVWAQKSDRQLIRMTVITLRDTLIAWYQRHGYQPTGETLPFPNDPKFGIPKQPLEFMVLEKKLVNDK